jgi:hypothetical protein
VDTVQPSLELVLVGAGPTASSLLERLVANAPELLAGRQLVIHLVDPHLAGTGRVWRPDLDRLLWMNSMAEDVTMFTDDSVTCTGPLWPGPTLHEWAHAIDDATLARLTDDDALTAEIRHLEGTTFPTRRVQSAYLRWFHERVIDSLPDGVEVVTHRHLALDVVDLADGRQHVVLDGADPIDADLVVLALGHLDAAPTRTSAAHAAFAASHGLAYLPAGHTADQDLSVLDPGADVVVLGFGQAFTDLMILVTEGRGGRFVDHADGWLTYEPSGLEPVLHVGSRRGVPYRSKLEQRLRAPLVPLPHFLDDPSIETLLARSGPLEFRRDVLPVLTKEIAWAYYHELFVGHPERVLVDWATFAERFSPLDWGADIEALVAATVPDPADHFEIASLDRPLTGRRWGSLDELQDHLRQHVTADVERRTDPRFSADLAAFHAMLGAFVPLGRIGASGRLTTRSRVAELGGWWFGFFMYWASGPPPRRLRQLRALADAGLVRFIGADTTVEADQARGRFVACSSSHPDEVVGTALVDARIAPATVSRSDDALLRALHARGEVREEVVSDGDEWTVNTGKVEVTGSDLRVVLADGSGHPRRHALGTFTNRPAAGTFARPRTNAATFRQNDVVARSILQRLPTLSRAPRATPSEPIGAGER